MILGLFERTQSIPAFSCIHKPYRETTTPLTTPPQLSLNSLNPVHLLHVLTLIVYKHYKLFQIHTCIIAFIPSRGPLNHSSVCDVLLSVAGLYVGQQEGPDKSSKLLWYLLRSRGRSSAHLLMGSKKYSDISR